MYTKSLLLLCLTLSTALPSTYSFLWTHHQQHPTRRITTRHHLLASSSSLSDDGSNNGTGMTTTPGEEESLSSAASKFSGAGPAQVDLNQYNLDEDDLERIAVQWAAQATAETALREAGVYLAAQNPDDNVVDTVKVKLERIPGQGLGIELLEVASGGDEGGLGITVVSGLVKGGCAEGSGLRKGDSIVKIAVVPGKSDATTSILQEITQPEIAAVSTECLGYDKTVEAIGSLPPVGSNKDDETLIVTVKRLRRKPKVRVTLQYPPEQNEDDISLELFAGENLRRAMLERGVRLNDPLARRFDTGGSGDCGASGMCATCAVSITRGEDLLNPKRDMEEQVFKDNPRWRLACKTIVGWGSKEGDLEIRVNPRQWN